MVKKENKKEKKSLQYTLPFILLVIVAALGLSYWNILQVKPVTNFEECVAARYPIKESFPVQCTTPQGKTFVQRVSPPPQEVVLRGTLTCLPHKDMNKPHTMECAFGLKDEHGNYYSLKDTDPNYKNVSQPSGKIYVAKGTLTPEKSDLYPIVGSITVKSLILQK